MSKDSQAVTSDHGVTRLLNAIFPEKWLPGRFSTFVVCNPGNPQDAHTVFTYFCTGRTEHHVMAISLMHGGGGELRVVLPVNRYVFTDVAHLVEEIGVADRVRQLEVELLNKQPRVDG